MRTARRQSATSEPLPPGATLASEFAQEHGVNRATFRDHYTTGKRGDVAIVSSRPKPGRPRETEYYVMPEQAEAIYAYWQRNDVPFTLSSSDQSED